MSVASIKHFCFILILLNISTVAFKQKVAGDNKCFRGNSSIMLNLKWKRIHINIFKRKLPKHPQPRLWPNSPNIFHMMSLVIGHRSFIQFFKTSNNKGSLGYKYYFNSKADVCPLLNFVIECLLAFGR